MGTRRTFSREFKLEAVRLVNERGVAVAQAARDLGLHENVLRKWVRELVADPQQAFPGQGQMKPEQAEIERVRAAAEEARAEGERRRGEAAQRRAEAAARGRRAAAFCFPAARTGRKVRHFFVMTG